MNKKYVNLDCDFDNNNLCSWRQDSHKSTPSWIFNNPKLNNEFTLANQYFPRLNQTGLKNIGYHYIFLKSFRKTPKKNHGILMSPLIQAQEPYSFCLS